MRQTARAVADPLGVPPLRLRLDPLVPDRVPARSHEALEYGYRLRLPGGPAVADDDPLLAAFGAAVVTVVPPEEHEQALQDARFEPGSPLRLLPDPFDEDDPGCVRVWDAEAVLEAGELSGRAAALALAGIGAGLGTRAVVVRELRVLHDHRRIGVVVLVHAPALVDVAPPPDEGFTRPERPARRRVVLFADGSGDVRWWDPAGDGGPGDVDELPVSRDLSERLCRLRDAYRALRRQEAEAGEAEGVEALELVWAREELDAQALALWRRARAELRRRYAVGFLGPDMRRPAWSPSDLAEDDGWDDEVPA